MGDSSDDSEGYERPVPCCKCDKQVEFVCEACQRSLCKSCVGEHVADRKSGSHDVKYHHSFREKDKKVFARGYRDQKSIFSNFLIFTFNM